ncbi:MAG TPA: chloride channel protein, partial [Acidovorax sp.]|nr:chloride channel protein [Acidovorax sp.]
PLYTLLKFIATWLTAWCGVPGGIFAPSLSIGAGNVLGSAMVRAWASAWPRRPLRIVMAGSPWDRQGLRPQLFAAPWRGRSEALGAASGRRCGASEGVSEMNKPTPGALRPWARRATQAVLLPGQVAQRSPWPQGAPARRVRPQGTPTRRCKACAGRQPARRLAP